MLEGKRVLLVEDSIVRSTTMRVLLERIRELGRRQGNSRPRRLPADHRALLLRHRHVDDRRAVRPAVPPRRAADARRSRPRWPRDLGADSLRYLPVESIARAIGLDADQLCQACITGEYPTPCGARLAEAHENHLAGRCGRTYDTVRTAD